MNEQLTAGCYILLLLILMTIVYENFPFSSEVLDWDSCVVDGGGDNLHGAL